MTYNHILVSRELGGAALVGLRIAEALRRRSQPSRVWIPGEGAALGEARRRGLDGRCYDAALLSGAQGRMQAALGNLGYLRDLKPEGQGVVHVHAPHAYRMLLPSLWMSGMWRVVHVHLDMETEGFRWAFRRPPHLIITCARYLIEPVRRSLPRSLQERQWIEAVPNAVDSQRFSPGDKQDAKRRVGAPVAAPLALMLANLAPHKGQETAIRAVAALKQAGVTIQCWLAGIEREGGTAFSSRLKALVAELGVADRIQFLGQRADTDVLLRAADFFLLPSTREGLPLSILEAQATKVPVLAAPTAGVPEVVADGKTGFLIPADDAQGYADRIKSLLENAELYERVAAEAHVQTAREMSWESHCERIIGLYSELTAGSRRLHGRGRLTSRRPSAAYN